MDKRRIYGKMVCANWGIRTALVPIQLSVENLNKTRQPLTSKGLRQLRSRGLYLEKLQRLRKHSSSW